MVKRNHSYNIGEVVEATGGYLLKCKVAGTTSSDPIVIGGGAELVDGTVTWQVIEDSDMPSGVYITIPLNSWGDWDDGNRWVAPADGYISATANGKTQTILLQSKDRPSSIIRADGYPTTFICVQKGVPCRWDGMTYTAFFYSVSSAKKLGLL